MDLRLLQFENKWSLIDVTCMECVYEDFYSLCAIVQLFMRRVLNFIHHENAWWIVYAYVLIDLMMFPSNSLRFTSMVCVYVNHYLLWDKNHLSLYLMMVEFISTMGKMDFLCMLHSSVNLIGEACSVGNISRIHSWYNYVW